MLNSESTINLFKRVDDKKVKAFKPKDIEIHKALTDIKTPFDIPKFFETLDIGLQNPTKGSKTYQTPEQIFESRAADCVERAIVVQYIFEKILPPKYEFYNMVCLFYPPGSFAYDEEFNINTSNILNRVLFKSLEEDQFYSMDVLALNLVKMLAIDKFKRRLAHKYTKDIKDYPFITKSEKTLEDSMKKWFTTDLKWLSDRCPKVKTKQSSQGIAIEKTYIPTEYRIYQYDASKIDQLGVFGYLDFEINMFTKMRPIKIFKVDKTKFG